MEAPSSAHEVPPAAASAAIAVAPTPHAHDSVINGDDANDVMTPDDNAVDREITTEGNEILPAMCDDARPESVDGTVTAAAHAPATVDNEETPAQEDTTIRHRVTAFVKRNVGMPGAVVVCAFFAWLIFSTTQPSGLSPKHRLIISSSAIALDQRAAWAESLAFKDPLFTEHYDGELQFRLFRTE